MQDPSATQTLTGACFCGQNRYTIDLGIVKSGQDDKKVPSNLTLTAYCHCTNCQRLNGSPFVWTTHWKREAVRWQGVNSNAKLITCVNGIKVEVPETLDLFESMPGRKFKLRCKKCGSPMGSYSISKHEWTIWGVSIDRHPAAGDHQEEDVTRPLIQSDRGSNRFATFVHGWNLIRPTAHQFYDTRILDIHDELSKWTGYEGSSHRLNASLNVS